ncbi:MAG: DUF362 domain-containing protein [Spirochaetaceae bacterium]|nr:DUF362 domain-containing protein [Spirochaetaceae bacterium]
MIISTKGFCADPDPSDIPGTESILWSHIRSGGSVVNLVENTDATDGGIEKLLGGMKDVSFYRLKRGGTGLISADDIVLIKINSQWSERGSTNTDLLKGLIGYILQHPDGFKGEIIVVDNGQGNMGSASHVGKLDWDLPNSKDIKQNTQLVIDAFADQGYKVSGVLWDKLTQKSVRDFDTGDNSDGFVVEPVVKSNGVRISYPKFTTKYGSALSLKKGLWDSLAKKFISDKLKIINVPVLKSNNFNQVDGALSSYLGTCSNALTDSSVQKNINQGGLGEQMINIRFPILNILDMIYIAPERGPVSFYKGALQKNMIAASTDPVALDYWAVKNVLYPAASGQKQALLLDPDNKNQGSFGYWLGKCLLELNKVGIPATMNKDFIKLTIITG